MKKMLYQCICLLIFTIKVQGSTHWMVTENGLIQPRVDSPFEMAHPYDLLAFLNQDTRWDNIIQLYHDLKERRATVKKLWSDLEAATDISPQLSFDDNCLKAGSLNLLDWYTSIYEDGKARNIPQEEFLLNTPIDDQDKDVPDCKKISSLTFSMFAFEHLEAMMHRQNLTLDPEFTLPDLISPIMTIDQFGHWVSHVLKKNSSSWLHYNMASLYWRVRGNSPKAMECSRRAVHYAPREYKDIALLSMGTILHRSKQTDDAITVLSAATEHGPQHHLNHFVLANAYAVIGDYNNSVIHYDCCMKLSPTFEMAEKHKYGVLCHKALMKNMITIKESLKGLKVELLEYNQREAHWLKSQASFLKTMRHSEKFDFTNVENNCNKMMELTGLNIKELKKEGDKNSLIHYFLENPAYNENWLQDRGVHAVESAYSLQRLVQHIEKHAHLISDYVTKNDHFKTSDGKIRKEIPTIADLTSSIINAPDPVTDAIKTKAKDPPSLLEKNKSNSHIEESLFEYEGGIVIYPPTLKVNRNSEDFDKDPNWPTKEYCEEKSNTFPSNLEMIYPVFLPFENKGILLKYLLTDKIGLSAHSEHELPWHPPVCPPDKNLPSGLGQKKSSKSQTSNEGLIEPLREKFLEYVGDGDTELARRMQYAEIGQRIYTALEMQVAPKWLLYVLSSLYWRVRNNNANALNCLLVANRTVPKRHKDLVLTSMASVYLEMGFVDEAFAAAEVAFHLSLYEPATNLMLAQLNMVRKNWNTQQFHLKQVVRVEPRFMGGLARLLLEAHSCRHLDTHKDMAELMEGEVCAQVEPGMSMLCERDGTNCHLTNIHCFSSREKAEGTTLIGLLELHDDDDDDDEDENGYDDGAEQVTDDMTHDVMDRSEHQQNYERMRHNLDSLLKDCGPHGCISLDVELKEDDCTYQYLQRGYWLHVISFKQLLKRAKLKLPSDIAAMSPSSKKIPECKLTADPSQDFFLEKISKIDIEGWEAMLTMMHQVAEMFDLFNYGMLGSKIAQYVDAYPDSWLGALAASWWCGAGGHGACCARCLLAAYGRAPPAHRRLALFSLVTILHRQTKLRDIKEMAYLLFYMSPKSKLEAFVVAISHTYLGEYEQAIWMYRYALSFDDKYLPAKACLHGTMCLMLLGENAKVRKLN